MVADQDVTFATNLGTFTVELFNNDAPQTVQNFLNYVQNPGIGQGYTDAFFSRSINNFVLQAGGYATDNGNIYAISTGSPVPSEYSVDHPDAVGTIAMAHSQGDINSATNQFFFNLTDNSNTVTDSTVFGAVVDGWSVVQQIATLPTIDESQNLGRGFENLPVEHGASAENVTTNDFVVFQITISCYCTGTLIATPEGEVVVESLAVGDLALTASGDIRRIKWIGRQDIDCRGPVDKAAALPVRIAANAFGYGKPHSDLYVSPGHSICVTVLDEIFIPASSLINGATVSQVDVDQVTYWHVELDEHDVLLANGLPAESYLDVGHRDSLSDPACLNDTCTQHLALATHCRPFVTEGYLVTAVKQRLRSHALALGWSLDDSPFAGLHALVDGQIVVPAIDGLVARFLLPATVGDVRLISASSIPNHVSDSADRRELGIAIRRLVIDDGLSVRQVVAADDPMLRDGCHEPEPSANGVFRWTLGSTRLLPSLWEACQESFFLRVELDSGAPPRWSRSAAEFPDVSPIFPAAAGQTSHLRLVG